MIHKLFPTPLYSNISSSEEYKNIKEELYSRIDLNSLEYNTPDDWICNVESTFNSYSNIIVEFKLDYLSNWIFQEVKKFMKDIEKNKLDLAIVNCWINKNIKNSFQEYHNHLPCFLSGVLYLKTSERDGNIVFRTPNPYSSLFPRVSNNIENFYKNYSFTPKEGLILIFPSWLEHSVEENKYDSERISISFNITIQNDIGV